LNTKEENDDSSPNSSGDAKASGESLQELMASARTILAAIKESADAASAASQAAADSQKQASGALTDLKATSLEITNLAAQAKTQITDTQSVIATKSDHIQKAQEHADKVRAELDRALTAATQLVTETEGLNDRSQSAADLATELLTSVRTVKGAAETDAEAVKEAKSDAQDATDQIKGLADIAKEIENRIAAYETRLDEIELKSEAQLTTIVGLLPGATSAGLAHSFDQRRQTFLKPAARWQWIFVGSVTLIVMLTLSSLWHIYSADKPLKYDDLLLLWLSRLPVVVALVWLALHAAHESALAKRLEEDYGYKSAIAASFQGFHNQMKEIEATTPPDSPLGKLCDDTLRTIASPPGRIYDKHKLTVSPTGEIATAAKNVVGTVKT
jgi:hypothetical protein